MEKITTKCIGYAYPTSTIAKQHGYNKSGCWYLAIGPSMDFDHLRDIRFTAINKSTVLLAAEGFKDLPWDHWSMHENEEGL